MNESNVIKVGDFVEWVHPFSDETFAGESVKYKVIEIDRGRVLMEAVTPDLHIRPTSRANVEELQKIISE